MELLVETVDAAGRGRIEPWGGEGGDWAEVPAWSLIGGEAGTWDRQSQRIVVTPGFLGDGELVPDPRNWSAEGWEALEAGSRRVLSRPGPRVLVRPAAGHVLSDAPSCARFLEAREEWGGPDAGRLGVLLDPIAMLRPEMLRDAEDHVARVLSIVLQHEHPGVRGGVDAVVLCNARDEGGVVIRTGLHRGVIPQAALRELAVRLVPAGMPVVLVNDEPERQASFLAGV